MSAKMCLYTNWKAYIL